jgi:excisionase family DNA binding protein
VTTTQAATNNHALELRAALANVDEKRLRFLVPDEVIGFLDDLVASPTGASRADAKESLPPNNRHHPGSATPETPPERHLLSAAEAARYLGLAVQTLAKMRVSGESPPYHKLGRSVVYDPTDLDAWLALRKRRSTSDRGSDDRSLRDGRGS